MATILTFADRIAKARAVHGDKYIYPEQDIKTNKDRVEIICPKHGPWKTCFNDHIYKQAGCPKCANEARAPISRERAKQMWEKKKEEEKSVEAEVTAIKSTNEQPYEGSKALFW